MGCYKSDKILLKLRENVNCFTAVVEASTSMLFSKSILIISIIYSIQKLASFLENFYRFGNNVNSVNNF